MPLETYSELIIASMWIIVLVGPISNAWRWWERGAEIRLQFPERRGDYASLTASVFLLSLIPVIVLVFAVWSGPHRTPLDALFLIIRDEWTLGYWATSIATHGFEVGYAVRACRSVEQHPGFFDAIDHDGEVIPYKQQVYWDAVKSFGGAVLFLAIAYFLVPHFWADAPWDILRPPSS